MRDVLPEIHARGAELVVVGNGGPAHAAAFRDEQKLTFPLLVDQERRAYAAAGLRRDVASLLRPATWRNALRARRAGFRQVGVQGDALQLGGVFVLHPDGRVPFTYVSSAPGDHPDPSAILAAL